VGYCKLQEKQDVLLVQPEEQGSEEEISLTSSEEAAELRAQSADDPSSSTKSPVLENTALANWDLRESIEITLTAQPEDTVMAEERLDIVITSNLFIEVYKK